MRLLPVIGDTLLDPFEARNTNLNLRFAARVEADAAALAPILRADDLLLWVGTGEPNVTATAPSGGCPIGVEFVGFLSMGESGSVSPKYGRGHLTVLSQTLQEQNKSVSLNLTVFQPVRSRIGGAVGFEASVQMSLKPSADGW
jgi:hypothetical protein